MVKKSKTSFDYGAIHFMPEYIRNPVEPITIILAGVGGTGSNLLMALAKINYALMDSGHPGIMLFAFDGEDVQRENIGRQNFSISEIGINKAIAIISRINRFYGINWKAYPSNYLGKSKANITISCTDSVTSRYKICNAIVHAKSNSEHANLSFSKRPYYWLDTGNDFDFGQIVLGTCGRFRQPSAKCVKWLPNLFELHPDFDLVEREEQPSCSLAQSLGKQDLFVNPIIANYAAHLLWKILRSDYIDYNALYVNLTSLKTNKRLLK